MLSDLFHAEILVMNNSFQNTKWPNARKKTRTKARNKLKMFFEKKLNFI